MYIYDDDAAPLLPKGTILHFIALVRQHEEQQVEPRSRSVGRLGRSHRRRDGPRVAQHHLLQRRRLQGRSRQARGSRQEHDEAGRNEAEVVARPFATGRAASRWRLLSPCTFAQQAGQGQLPSQLPLSLGLRERGSSVTPARSKAGSRRRTAAPPCSSATSIATRSRSSISRSARTTASSPAAPTWASRRTSSRGRQWGIFTIKLPKDFGDKKLTWTIVANGFTNTITLHTKTDYILEPYRGPGEQEHAADAEVLADGHRVHGPARRASPRSSRHVGSEPLPLTIWATDEAAKTNIRRRFGGAASQGGKPAPPAAAEPSSGVTFRGPGTVTFDAVQPEGGSRQGRREPQRRRPSAHRASTSCALQANDSTGEGGGGFQCCWTNAHVKVTVKPAATQ